MADYYLLVGFSYVLTGVNSSVTLGISMLCETRKR